MKKYEKKNIKRKKHLAGMNPKRWTHNAEEEERKRKMVKIKRKSRKKISSIRKKKKKEIKQERKERKKTIRELKLNQRHFTCSFYSNFSYVPCFFKTWLFTNS